MRNLPTIKRAAGYALAATIAIASMGASALADNTASKERRFATLAPQGSAWMKVLDRGAAEVEKRTDGRIVTKYYPNGVMGDERDVIRKMRLGQLDGAAVTSVGLALIYEGIRVLELPRMFENIEEMEYVRNKMWPYFEKKFEEKGFVLLSKGEVGWIYFYSNTPVSSLSDLRKAKVWMWTDDAVVKSMFKKLNVPGVPTGVPDVLPSLTSGRINAAYSSPLAAMALQWNTKVKYMTSMPMSYALGSTILVKKAWDEISAEDRKTIEKIFHKQTSKLEKIIRRDNETARNQMIRKGVKDVPTPPEMVRDFDKAAQEVWQELVGKVYSQAELDMVLEYRGEYRAKPRG